MTYDDDIDDEWSEDEGDPEDDVLECPSCGRSVHEDAQQCPHCGDWITPIAPRHGWSRKVWLAAAVLLMAAMVMVAVF